MTEPNTLDEQIREAIRTHDQILAPKGQYEGLLDETVDKLKALFTEHSKQEQTRLDWLDEQIQHLLNDIYPEDLFTPPTDEDYKKANDFDANLHTRLHCDGIRHGLQILRREARGLSARDDLPKLSKRNKGEDNE